jgi:hypothetical protein
MTRYGFCGSHMSGMAGAKTWPRKEQCKNCKGPSCVCVCVRVSVCVCVCQRLCVCVSVPA